MPKVEGEQHQEVGESREPIRILNDVAKPGLWIWLLASIDRSIPRPRIDLQTLREVVQQQKIPDPEEHSHPGLPGSCLGTINLSFQSEIGHIGGQEDFCIVEDENRGVVLNRSLIPDGTQSAVFPIANQGDENNKDQNRSKAEAKQRAKNREKEKSRKKDEQRREKDKEIRGSSSTQQHTS